MSIEKLLLAKLETTPGFDRSSVNRNAIEIILRGMLRYEGNKVAQDVDRHILGGKPRTQANPHT